MNNNEQIQQNLFNNVDVDKKSISEPFVEQYKLFLDSIDKVTEKRQNANSYFLTINTGVCSLVGYFLSKDVANQIKSLFWILPIAGILLSYFWHRLVKSYRQLNTAKFLILHLIEEKMPLSPSKAEWLALGEGKDKKLYTPLTDLESWIPKLFIVMYTLLVFYFVLWNPFLILLKILKIL
jgi:hypothetical protein